MASLEDISFETRDQLALLAQQLSENPETRKDFLRLTKKMKPDMPIPELEIEEYTNKAISSQSEEMQRLRDELMKRDAVADLEKRRSKLLKKGLVNSEEDIEEVEKVMLEKGITNHEAAAEYWAFMRQAAVPTPSGYNPSAINKFDLNKYWKNPVAGAREEASKALNEFRKNPRPIGL